MSKSQNRVVNAKFSTPLPSVAAKNYSQERLISAILSPSDECVIAAGAAGTGKTYLAGTLAADLWLAGDYNRIIVCRPVVPAGEDMGHLPGELDEKLMPWMEAAMEPIRNRLKSFPGKLDAAMNKGNIECAPLYLMRGRNLDGSIVILDEAQNATRSQLEMICTRIGVNSKLIICGDVRQSDTNESGLQWLLNTIGKYMPEIEVVDFRIQDCVRSGICKRFLETFNEAD